MTITEKLQLAGLALGIDCMDCFLGICAVPGCCMVTVSAAEAAGSARGGARR